MFSFGNKVETKDTTGRGFGQRPQQNTATDFSFGPPPTFSFGSASTQPAPTTTSGFGFGGSTTGFGASAAATSNPFGSQPQPTTSGFGFGFGTTSPSTASSPFGNPFLSSTTAPSTRNFALSSTTTSTTAVPFGTSMIGQSNTFGSTPFIPTTTPSGLQPQTLQPESSSSHSTTTPSTQTQVEVASTLPFKEAADNFEQNNFFTITHSDRLKQSSLEELRSEYYVENPTTPPVVKKTSLETVTAPPTAFRGVGTSTVSPHFGFCFGSTKAKSTTTATSNLEEEEHIPLNKLNSIFKEFDPTVSISTVEDIKNWLTKREKQYQTITSQLKNENMKLKQGHNNNEIIEWEVNEDVNKTGTLIGKSQFEVYKLHGQDIAAKVIPLNPMKPEDSKQALNEIEVMKQLFISEIPPIVKIKGFSIDERKGLFILYSDYYPHGNLASLLYSPELSGQYCNSWLQKYQWIVSCVKPLIYLHSKNVLHKDVKPENYLIKDLHSAKVDITDFGISKTKSMSTTYTTTLSPSQSMMVAGSAQYKPPELYSAKFKNFSDKQDIYSLGVLMWEIIHLQKPLDGCDTVTIMGTVMNDEYPLDVEENVPLKWKELMHWCWRKKPEERPSALEVMNFLRKYKEELSL